MLNPITCRRTRRTILTLLIVLAFHAPPASSIVYVMPTDESMVDRAPIIVFGEVLTVQPGPAGASPTTEYLFAVEEVLKGFVAGSGIMIRQPGGVAADGAAMWVAGLPMLAQGDRVLLFLRSEENGAHAIVDYALGMFWEVDVGGRSLLVREASLEGAPPLETPAAARGDEAAPRDSRLFRRWIADRAVGLERGADYSAAELPSRPLAAVAPYRLSRLPAGQEGCFAAFEGLPFRWQEFDRGASLGFVVHSEGQPAVPGGGLRQVRAGMRLWNDDPQSRVDLTVLRTTNESLSSTEPDGVRSIMYEDPHDEIEGRLGDDGEESSVLAIARVVSAYCASHMIPGGSEDAVALAEVNIVTQDGLAEWLQDTASAANVFERIIAHELGHAIGIAHPCETDESDCNDSHPHRGALMYPTTSGSDGSRARLHADDRDAVRHLYPARGDSRAPDLVVESPRSTETAVALRRTFRFAATVRNQGEGRSAATTLRYYRSSDSRITTSDTELGTDPIGALSASATDRQSIGQRAPATDGTYYYGACVDSVAGESDTTNNCSTGVRIIVGDGGTSAADLVVESPRSTETAVAPRGTFRFAATVRNQGDGRSSATTLRYYRSSDSRITTSDTELGTDAIPALSASATDRQSIGQRAPSSDGTYYYGACVDPVAGEADITNNCSSGVRVTVGDGGGGAAGADLIVESPRANETSVAPRGAFRFAATVRNSGDGRSNATTLRYYRSFDSRITTADRAIGTDAIGPLSASATDRQSIGQRAPTTAGRYYYGACVDAVAGESDTTNNCSNGVPITVSQGPDDVIGTGFDLDSDYHPQGIGYAQGRFYVGDYFDHKMYAYGGSDGRRDPAADFDLNFVSRWPRITYAEGRFYVVEWSHDKAYAYRGSDGRRDAAADFDLDSNNRGSYGITYAEGRFYVMDQSDDKVYAYRGSDGRRDAAADFDLDNTYPAGIAYGQGRFYVVDQVDDKVYAYRGSDGHRDAAADFGLDSNNGSPEGIVYAGGKLFVLDNIDDKVYAYSLDGGGGGGDGDDHGGTFADATSVAVPSTTTGELEQPGDKDYFRLVVAQATLLTVETTGGTDTHGTLFDGSRASLESDDDGGAGYNFKIERNVGAGTYYVQVRGYDSATTGAYELRVSTSGSGGDGGEFDVLEGLRIADDGSLTLQAGGVFQSVGSGGCIRGRSNINGRIWEYHWSAWQRNTGSGWREVSGSRNTGGLCGYDLNSAASGRYRLVGDLTAAGTRGLYKSENEITK